jgi:hypothetical protein
MPQANPEAILGRAMDPLVARSIAHYSHRSDRNRFNEPVIEHVERVAAAVPDEVRSIAFLHDVLEGTATDFNDLCAQGLTPLERAALELLTHEPGESYELYVLRIAWAGDEAGAMARTVKLADLDDHLAHPDPPDGAPPYGWARRHIAVAEKRSAA